LRVVGIDLFQQAKDGRRPVVVPGFRVPGESRAQPHAQKGRQQAESGSASER
jgi:hypothetical protein